MGDLGGRERIRRRDDRTEDERRRPGEVRDHRVCDQRHATRRRRNQPDGEERDRPQIGAQVAQAGEEGCRVEERWQDRNEHEVRRQLELRQARDEPQHEPSGDEKDRHGQSATRGDREHRRERGEQDQQLELVVGGELHLGPR